MGGPASPLINQCRVTKLSCGWQANINSSININILPGVTRHLSRWLHPPCPAGAITADSGLPLAPLYPVSCDFGFSRACAMGLPRLVPYLPYCCRLCFCFCQQYLVGPCRLETPLSTRRICTGLFASANAKANAAISDSEPAPPAVQIRGWL